MFEAISTQNQIDLQLRYRVNALEANVAGLKAGYVTSYGATGNGTTDDTKAIQLAIDSNDVIYFPSGTYLITAPLVDPGNKIIYGNGRKSIIKATDNSINLIHRLGTASLVHDLTTLNGNAAMKFYGATKECTNNLTYNFYSNLANYGLVLDGYTNTSFPCYWNSFQDILIERPKIQGVYLTKSGAGDTPNANKFSRVRVYSHGDANTISGSGFYIEYGAFNNSFLDCEANVATSAVACFRLGANANTTIFINPYAETNTSIPNFQLDSGSLNTIIINELSASAGSSILDNSGGAYTTFNSGSPVKNLMANLNIGYGRQVVANTLTPVVQTHGLDSNAANWGVYRYSANNVGARICLNKTRSTTIGNQGLVQNNDDLGYIDFNGSDNNQIRASVQIKGSVDATVTSGGAIVPGRAVISTVNPGGTLTEAMRVDSKQNVVVSTAALSTSATDGFLYIPTCAGAPSGTPTSYSGRVPLVYDTTNNKLMAYNGAWKGVVLS